MHKNVRKIDRERERWAKWDEDETPRSKPHPRQTQSNKFGCGFDGWNGSLKKRRDSDETGQVTGSDKMYTV